MKEILIKIKSEMENIQNMRNMIQALVANKNQTLTFINELKTIVSEGITNAIIHGYDEKDDMDIDLKIKMNEDGIYIIIEDYGKGIKDVNQAREVLFTTMKTQDRSGLGFTIMELFSTNFLVESELGKGTRLTIYKAFE